MTKKRDGLDIYIEEREKREPGFKQLIEEEKRKLMLDTSVIEGEAARDADKMTPAELRELADKKEAEETKVCGLWMLVKTNMTNIVKKLLW